MPLGHELAGVVEALGSEVGGLSVGDRVVLNPMGDGNMIGNGGGQGGFAPLLLIPNAAGGGSLFKIPDTMSSEVAALCEPLGVGMQAVNRAGVSPGSKVVIFGAGPIGLTATATCSYRGIDDVVVVDLSSRRLEIAQQLGARTTINASEPDLWERLRAVLGTKKGLGMPAPAADAYIEATGNSKVLTSIIANAKDGATLSVVGLHREDVPVSFLLVMAKALTIAGSMAYPEDYEDTIRMLTNFDLSPMVTHRFPLDDFAQALAVAQDPSAGGKVLVLPNG
jgi:(R,R)-butanediol dehydrogenase/meso-butanediol dehydrogenase/diacetyl reductase